MITTLLKKRSVFLSFTFWDPKLMLEKKKLYLRFREILMACSSICLLLGVMKYHKISLPFVIVKMNCSNKPKKMIMKKKH